MYYAIMGMDREESLEARRQARQEHLNRLNVLMDEGRLLLAGPHPAIDSEEPGAAGFTGSLIVAEFSDLEQAKAWVSEDPYTVSGVFSSVTVIPFNKTLP